MSILRHTALEIQGETRLGRIKQKCPTLEYFRWEKGAQCDIVELPLFMCLHSDGRLKLWCKHPVNGMRYDKLYDELRCEEDTKDE